MKDFGLKLLWLSVPTLAFFWLFGHWDCMLTYRHRNDWSGKNDWLKMLEIKSGWTSKHHSGIVNNQNDLRLLVIPPNDKSLENYTQGFLWEKKKSKGKLCLDLISLWEIIAIRKSRQMGLRHFAGKNKSHFFGRWGDKGFSNRNWRAVGRFSALRLRSS